MTDTCDDHIPVAVGSPDFRFGHQLPEADILTWTKRFIVSGAAALLNLQLVLSRTLLIDSLTLCSSSSAAVVFWRIHTVTDYETNKQTE